MPLPKVARDLLKPVVMSALLTWERLESGVSFNITSERIRDNPYDKYRQLHLRDPVHRLRLIDGWALARYEDVDAALRDHRRFSNGGRDFGYLDYTTLLDLDPPDHTRLRSLVSQAFTRNAVADLAPGIRQTADTLLDDLSGKDRFELIRDFAYPLAVMVIAKMMGVPQQDMERFRGWSDALARTTEPLLTDEDIQEARRANEELFDYLGGIIDASGPPQNGASGPPHHEQRSESPRDDLISALLAAEEEGNRLTREELLSTLMLLLVAGNETTRNLIGNGMLALLRNPDQMQRLRDNPDLLDSAIDEFLRYDSPVQLDTRVSQEDFQIGGKRIHRGQRVICLLGAANRDPSAFVQPDMLDIGRLEKSHISFGRGIHHCLGAPLALLEGRIAFSSLVERFSSIRLAAEPNQRSQMALRGVQELWVEVEHAPRCETSAARPLCFRPTPP